MVETTVKETFKNIDLYTANPLGDMRVIDEFPCGCHVRQGDVYITRISNFAKNDCKLTNDKQLAPGTSAGSRHIVSDAVNVFIADDHLKCVKNAHGFVVNGPIVEAFDRWTVMHPEHADISMPEGIYKINYQCDPNTLNRVLD